MKCSREISFAHTSPCGPIGHVNLVSAAVAGEEHWVGFSTAEFSDRLPRLDARMKRLTGVDRPPAIGMFKAYKTLDYVQMIVRELAASLAELAKKQG